ncbi:MAG: glycosyltransferase [Oligoflexia bacterium]|nr:glycosyltransferase [Oligoflexia bacterium]
MKVSVIIPTFNRAYCLDRAVNSVLAQKYTDYELLIIDDGSTDNTEKKINYYRERDPRVRAFRNRNSGVSQARNLGILNARGSFIAFLDSDDEWLPGKLLCQMEFYEKHEYSICHTDEIWIRNGNRVNQMHKHKKSGGCIFRQCLPLCCISPSSVIIRKDVFDRVGLFDEELPVCEDYDLWLRISAVYEVSFIQTPLIIKYGGHSDQLSRRSWGNDEYRVRALVKIVETGSLSTGDREAAVSMINKKSGILYKGFLKHGNNEKADYYKRVINKYSNR